MTTWRMGGAMLFLFAIIGIWMGFEYRFRSSAQSQANAVAGISPPIGTIMAYAGPVSEKWEETTGWLVCDGRAFPHPVGGKYTELFNAIGESWGGDGDSRFHIPDLRGRFIRGVDKDVRGVATTAANGGPRDPDRDRRSVSNPFSINPAVPGNARNLVGSMQKDALQQHEHDLLPRINLGHTVGGNGHARMIDSDDGASWSGINEDMKTAPTGGTETRPVNAYVYWIIRYR